MSLHTLTKIGVLNVTRFTATYRAFIAASIPRDPKSEIDPLFDMYGLPQYFVNYDCLMECV